MADIGNTGLTALAGGGKTGATALAYGVNRISTVATSGDSVQLPAAVQGQLVRIINAGANPCIVFPAGTDTVNGLATTLGISQGPGTIQEYVCSVAPTVTGTPTVLGAGNWEGAQIGAVKMKYASIPTTNGALNPHVSATYFMDKAGVAAMTLAAPTATTDDGVTIRLVNTNTNQHTLTATGLFLDGSTHTDVCTMAAHGGCAVEIVAWNAKWLVVFNNLCVFT